MNYLKNFFLSSLLLISSYSFGQDPKVYFSLVGRKVATVVGQDINVNGFYVGQKNSEKWDRFGWKNAAIFGITVDKKYDGKNIFLACGNGVMRSTDYGKSFKIITDWQITEVQKVYIDPKNEKTLYLTSSFGVWKSNDYGETWSKKLKGLELVSQTYNPCLVILPSNPKTLMMATADGIVISKNGGDTWSTLALKGKEINDIQIAPYDEKLIICTTENDGIFISKDGGKNWKQSNNKLNGTTFYTIAIDPVNKGTFYCGGFQNGIQKSTDFGETWTGFKNEISDLDIHSIAIYLTDPKTIFAGSTNYGFFRSDNSGENFKCVGEADGVIWHITIN